jgi:signal transduction histidine kinase
MFHIEWLRQTGIIFILLGYSVTAWAVTVHKVFDVRQVLHWASYRCVATAAFLSISFTLFALLRLLSPIHIAIIISASGSFLLLAVWADDKIRLSFGLDDDTLLAEFRAKVIAAARSESAPHKLIQNFLVLMRDYTSSSDIALVFEQDRSYNHAVLDDVQQSGGLPALVEEGWATIESIDRRRRSDASDALRHVMSKNKLGLMIAVTNGSPYPPLVLSVGRKANAWPFTYPEIRRMQNIAELMDNILMHSRLTSQAAMKARVEHLSIMSRGLAHDLRNLITPVSSYLVHTESLTQKSTEEEEVHDAAKRAITVMDKYSRQVMAYADRQEPSWQKLNLLAVAEVVLEICRERARRRSIEVALNRLPPSVIIGDAVLIQRMLTNLVENAIDASREGASVNITIACINSEAEILVADSGVGIAEEHLDKVFEPYFTTKRYGNFDRGFGLGLTIAQKIVLLHGGCIRIKSVLGAGTSILVRLPKDQPDFKADLVDVQ